MLATNRTKVTIDTVHSRAICDEIGERLRVMLGRSMPTALPPRLQFLLDQLAAADEAPSIVPSIGDMIDQTIAAQPDERPHQFSSR